MEEKLKLINLRIDKGNYVKFSLIESRFQDKNTSGVLDIRAGQQALENAEKTTVLQAKIDLVSHISAIAGNAVNQGNKSTKNVRQNRKREERKIHIDFVRGTDNE